MLAANEKRLRWWGMDMRPRWRRRVAVVVTYMAFLAAISFSDQPWWGHPMITTMTLLVAVQCVGVFRSRGPLKNFEGLVGEKPGARMIVNGLDEWASYRYGAPAFDEATEEQQAELLRSYRVGNFAVPATAYTGEVLDERELREWAVQCGGR